MLLIQSRAVKITPLRAVGALLLVLSVYVVGPLIAINSVTECFIVPEFTLTNAEKAAGLASGIGTLFLVLLTGWYSIETRRMVQIQKNQRTQVWYDDTLSITRRIADTWRHLATTELEDDGKVDLTQHSEEWERIKSLVDKLDEQISRRPTEVDSELTDSAQSFLNHWRLFSRSPPYRIGTESELFNYLSNLERNVETESEQIRG